MSDLPIEKIEWLRDRWLDPIGRVFRFEGEIFRAIYPAQVEHVRALFSKGIVEDLVAKGLLVRSEITNLGLPDFGLVLKHETLPFPTKCFEWPRTFMRDAALCVLDLNLALLPHGLGTVDGHGGNIGQIGEANPIWFDFGSLVPLKDLETPLEEFRRFFVRPLEMLVRAPEADRQVRQIVRGGGIDEAAFTNLLHSPWSVQRWLPRVRGEIRRRTAGSSERNDLSRERREALLRNERERIASLDLRLPRTTWGAYHQTALDLFPDDYESFGSDVRKTAIFQLLRTVRPRQLIDLAANAGFFSFFAARQGAVTMGLDFDEAAVDRFYRTAREKGRGLSLVCACADVMEPPPVPRQADCVLALALTHHLALGQGYTFAAIAAALARFSTDHLMVEFMANGLGGSKPMPDPLPEWYRLDAFLDSLRPHFGEVKVVGHHQDSAQSLRILIHASGRKGNAVFTQG